MRFRPEQHLRRQSDFRAVREHGRRYNCGPFTLWCLRRDPATTIRPVAPADLRRVGVVASTASVGHAVLRNRAKRRLREIFRRHQESVPAGCDLLLTARAAMVDAPLPELEKKFVEACQRVAPREKQ
jgi:ribonuclease P protein component